MGDVSVAMEAESLEIAEEAIHEIVCRIQPTLVAHQNRKQVVDYVQGLIRHSLAYEVFPYGSVPLKTYLPDGDIDLTALSSPMIEDALVSDVHALLKGEELNEAAPYEVKDVHCIDAEVKLVKCLVQNIVVDISFNQLGGLCTLCFLEQVDRLIGKDHLFKRSIILIKAWCYYESRILGAHHGLISTYALETLVLYIFHQFHSSLTGPLAVLYRFLDYFSKFDWENYCVSLNGPVCKSSLPDIVADLPENGRDDLLLSEEFLRKCVDMFSVPSRGLETNLRAFPQKHLNIIDPLKENNNLGRSVNRGNFYRIRSAFKYGARKLGQLLLLPRERIADELNKFFTNTLERHGSNCWTDEHNLALSSGARGSDQSLSSSNSDNCSEDSMYLKSSPADYSDAVSGFCLTGIDREFLTSEYLAMRNANDSSGGSSRGHNFSTSLSGNSHHAPQSSFSGLFRQNGKIENGNPCGKTSATSVADDKMSNSIYSCSNHESVVPNGSARSTPSASISGSSESLNSLLELSGDYDSHFRSVLYSQYCHLSVSGPILPSPPISSQLLNKNSRETIWESLQSKQNGHSQMNTNGVLAPPFYPMNPTVLSSGVFGSEEKKKPRGTGTYFPNMKILSNRDRPSSGRGRFQATGTHSQMQRHTFDNGSAAASREMGWSEDGSHDLSHEEHPVLGNGKSRSSDFHRPHLSMWGSSNATGFCCPSEKLESRSGGLQLRGALVAARSTQPDSGTYHSWGSASSPLVPAVQSPKAVVESNQERNAEQSYKLKNEVDFPPLSL